MEKAGGAGRSPGHREEVQPLDPTPIEGEDVEWAPLERRACNREKAWGGVGRSEKAWEGVRRREKA